MSSTMLEVDCPPPIAATDDRHAVVQVTYSLIAGGSETYALTLASHVDATRFRTVLIALDKGGALEPEIRARGIPYHVLHRPQRVDWRIMRRLYRLFRQHRARTVQTHHFAQLAHALLAARLAGARVIHVEHSVQHYQRRKLRWLLRLGALLCDKVVAIGDDVARVLRDDVGIPAGKLAIIRAGIAPAEAIADRAATRRELGLSLTQPTAIIVARLAPEKNHQLLLAAFDQVRQALPEAILLIVGDGPEEDAIQRQIDSLRLANHVRVLGVRRDVPRLLAAADAFVLSSTREGLPIAALEAMAAGLPVVATAVGDLPRIVVPGETGLLAPSGDAAALARALVDVLAHAGRSRRMGARGKALVERHYSLESMIASHEGLYAA